MYGPDNRKLHNMLTDNTIATTAEYSQYTSPEIREIRMRNGSSILSSSNEDYKNNEPDDWF